MPHRISLPIPVAVRPIQVSNELRARLRLAVNLAYCWAETFTMGCAGLHHDAFSLIPGKGIEKANLLSIAAEAQGDKEIRFQMQFVLQASSGRLIIGQGNDWQQDPSKLIDRSRSY